MVDWVFFHLKYEAFYDIRHVYTGSGHIQGRMNQKHEERIITVALKQYYILKKSTP
jgi:hypothetical protein